MCEGDVRWKASLRDLSNNLRLLGNFVASGLPSGAGRLLDVADAPFASSKLSDVAWLVSTCFLKDVRVL